MSKTLKDAKLINKKRCIIGIIMGSIMSFLAFIVLILNISNFYNQEGPEVGRGTFRMFTTLSNVLCATASILTIPFQIEGLRKNNYHLPRWIVDLFYIGTVGVSTTFLMAITAISITYGFSYAMLLYSNLLFHTINPIIAIIIFTLINSDHNIKFYKSFITIIPIFIYGMIYLVMAILIGHDNGGWRDVYRLNAVIPWPITYIIMFGICFGIANLLRFLHNKRHKFVKDEIIRYYKESDDFDKESIEEAVKTFAIMQKNDYASGNLEVPVRILKIFKERYNSDKSLEELSSLFVKYYFEA